jgi:hypothetical protein
VKVSVRGVSLCAGKSTGNLVPVPLKVMRQRAADGGRNDFCLQERVRLQFPPFHRLKHWSII